jgi:putative redox protein
MPKITTVYKGDMLLENRLGNHTVLVDVPQRLGGSDRGPIPSELFAASLGSCISALVADHCRRSGIDVEGMSVDVAYDKLDNPLRFASIKVTIDLPGADSETKRRAVLDVAERCPVHNTIVSGAEIEIGMRYGAP